MTKIILNPSIATELDINYIGKNERVPIKFTADENWTGEFDIKIYNSIAKNSVITPALALTVTEKIMTLIIDPTAQSIAIGSHYYEISSTSAKRVLFKGSLNITK